MNPELQTEKPRVAFHTLGCKLNFTESSALGHEFVSRGFQIGDTDSPCDVVVLNTCSVTERADREARQWIRRVLRTSPRAFVAVVGCYAQLEPEEIASIDGVDVVLGAKEKFKLFDLVSSFEKNDTTKIFVSDIGEANDFGPAFSSEAGNRTRAFLKVQDGCDYTCSFCTIPLARGESRSQSIDQTVLQARQLVSLGYKEIVLTGVNVGDYGRKNGTSFLQLLRALDEVDVPRIRISSIEPNLLTKEIIDFVYSSEKFCRHFHLPLQSGSDEILKQMRRRYSTDDYRRVVDYLKSKDNDVAIGVDVIVGFPGETENHFEETWQFLIALPCSYLHVFTYSERPNTVAAESHQKIEPRIRFKRNETLRLLSQKKRRDFYSKFVGSTVDVLVEQKSDGENFSGFTSNYVRVEIPATDEFVNTIIPVHIQSLGEEHCFGNATNGTYLKKNNVQKNTSQLTFATV
ncbi:MAG: tRNA (N(6)-L-threonylcarbamoyladenosine(37)-C(2))-methylthiotransferase MtaB [Ignavibacteriales bacterium]|nr:tRNA (N(6)-L-threonylcarbamoyladenosine(37)-C(2))-methylthiotransferase MtaB [Ignavibacteriales bacterium]